MRTVRWSLRHGDQFCGGCGAAAAMAGFSAASRRPSKAVIVTAAGVAIAVVIGAALVLGSGSRGSEPRNAVEAASHPTATTPTTTVATIPVPVQPPTAVVPVPSAPAATTTTTAPTQPTGLVQYDAALTATGVIQRDAQQGGGLASINSLGDRICSDLAAGRTVESILSPYVNAGMSGAATLDRIGDIGLVVNAAVRYLCPQYRAAVSIYERTLG